MVLRDLHPQAMLSGYRQINPMYEYLFNSYYDSVGPQWARAHPGHLSRPTVAEVYDFRVHVDRSMLDLIETTAPAELPRWAPSSRWG